MEIPYSFLYEGNRIADDDTPGSLAMEEGDAIDVMVEREFDPNSGTRSSYGRTYPRLVFARRGRWLHVREAPYANQRASLSILGCTIHSHSSRWPRGVPMSDKTNRQEGSQRSHIPHST